MVVKTEKLKRIVDDSRSFGTPIAIKVAEGCGLCAAEERFRGTLKDIKKQAETLLNLLVMQQHSLPTDLIWRQGVDLSMLKGCSVL